MRTKQSSGRMQRSRVRRLNTLSTATSYAAVIALIASIISVGYQSPVDQRTASGNKDNSSVAMQSVKPSVDQVVAADLAASTAQVANLSVASNASNLSISLNAKSSLAQTDDAVLSKPQIVQAGVERRGVTDYTTVAGDTVESIATRYGISAQTLKWSNQLTSDALAPGKVLQIPGTDGVIYTVKDGDTLESIAEKYAAAKQRIVTYNDLEVSGIASGQRLVLPGGVLPANERPESIQRSTAGSGSSSATRGNSQNFTLAGNAASVGNRYDYGYCTWYAYNRRAELGRPVGSFWGNAATWAGFARGSGYLVNNTPAVGAVMQDSYTAGGYGHVAVVESVGADGSVTISEMNYAGWNVLSTRTLDAGQAARYNYIH